jgi:hypothetical protein
MHSALRLGSDATANSRWCGEQYRCTPLQSECFAAHPHPFIPLCWSEVASRVLPASSLRMPPGSAPTWAALPQELVQQVAGLLRANDRWVGAPAGGGQGASAARHARRAPAKVGGGSNGGGGSSGACGQVPQPQNAPSPFSCPIINLRGA